MDFLLFLGVVLQYMTWNNKIHYFNKLLELSSGFVNTDERVNHIEQCVNTKTVGKVNIAKYSTNIVKRCKLCNSPSHICITITKCRSMIKKITIHQLLSFTTGVVRRLRRWL